MDRAQKEYINEERKWLDEYNNAYHEALDNMSNPDYVRGLLRGVEEKLSPALGYNPVEHEPHVAVFILGAMQAKLEKLLTQLHFVDNYEDRRRDLDEVLANVEPQDTGSHGGRPGADDIL